MIRGLLFKHRKAANSWADDWVKRLISLLCVDNNNDQQQSERVMSLQPAELIDSDVARTSKRVPGCLQSECIILEHLPEEPSTGGVPALKIRSIFWS